MTLEEALKRIISLEGEVVHLQSLLALLQTNTSSDKIFSPINSSPQNIRRQLWFDFCLKYKIYLPAIPLFKTVENRVQTVDRGRSGQPVLARSDEMESLFLREVRKVIEDFEKNTQQYDGLIYMMYKLVENQPIPLYIGKTEKFGKQGGNLSANLKGISLGTGHPFARWGYNYAYHIGELSSILLNHRNVTPVLKYVRWAEALFEKPYQNLNLKEPVYIWAQAWTRAPIPVLPQLGPVKLTFLEYILIGIASAEFPELLNEEGTNRE